MDKADLQLLQSQVGIVDVYETRTYGSLRRNAEGEIIGDLSIEVRDHGAEKAPGRYTAIVTPLNDRGYAGLAAESAALAVASAVRELDLRNPPRVSRSMPAVPRCTDPQKPETLVNKPAFPEGMRPSFRFPSTSPG